LQAAGRRVAEIAKGNFQIVVLGFGYLASAWRNCDPFVQFPMNSASRGKLSSMLGIALGEQAISSIDDAVVDYYLEMVDVSENEGLKPGQVFHFQTFSMCVLQHAIANAFGDPIQEKLAGPLGCSWTWRGVDTRILIHLDLDLVAAAVGVRDSVFPTIVEACEDRTPT
jgi:hypothetical protein